jgi:hypothetical protein
MGSLESTAMAKVKATKMNATAELSTTAEKPALKPVRLQLTEPDHKRLEKQAKKRGLNLASYARQAVLEKIMADEAGDDVDDADLIGRGTGRRFRRGGR